MYKTLHLFLSLSLLFSTYCCSAMEVEQVEAAVLSKVYETKMKKMKTTKDVSVNPYWYFYPVVRVRVNQRLLKHYKNRLAC